MHAEEIIPQSTGNMFCSLTLTGEGVCHFGEVVSYDQDINCFFVTQFSCPIVDAHQFPWFRCVNGFKGCTGCRFKDFANNTSFTSSYMVYYVCFHASQEKPFSDEGEGSCPALMASIVMETKENLMFKAIWYNELGQLFVQSVVFSLYRILYFFQCLRSLLTQVGSAAASCLVAFLFPCK